MQDDFVQGCLVGDGLKGGMVVVVYDMWNGTNCYMEGGVEEWAVFGRFLGGVRRSKAISEGCISSKIKNKRLE